MAIDKVIIGNLQDKDFSPAAAAGDNQLDFWTTEALIDELSVCLAKVKEVVTNKENDGRQLTVRKYYRQARDLMKWIPVAKPSPAFIIYISDLPPQLIPQLEQLIPMPDDTLKYVLHQAVGRIFENLDFEKYHLSIARNLHMRFEK